MGIELLRSAPVDTLRQICVGVGRTSEGRIVSWLSCPDNDTAQVPLPGSRDLLTAPDGFTADEMLAVSRLWPAWRVVDAARLELGAGVLVLGGGGLADHVLQLCGLRGALWRAVCGALPGGADCERVVAGASQADPDALSRALPSSPDAILVLDGFVDALRAALRLCRSRGTVVTCATKPTSFALDLYADLHRRGLRIVAVDPLDRGAVEDWPLAALRIRKLLEAGRLRA